MNAGLALGERSWTCPCCGTVLDRDGNAAENLRRLGPAAMGDDPVPEELRAWERWITDASRVRRIRRAASRADASTSPWRLLKAAGVPGRFLGEAEQALLARTSNQVVSV